MLAMKDMLKEENIYFKERADHWEEAIHIAVQPLVEQGYCEACYIDGIIQNTHELGPYYVLMPELALLHARPEQGAIKTQVCITILKHPIKFKEDGEDVRILITLVGEDTESHLLAIQAIANIFCEQDGTRKVLGASTPKEIYDMFIRAAYMDE